MEKDELYNQMIKKSKEAFVVAIELYNKPTLEYRVEGFAFFVCNAWELMLKAYILKKEGEASLYYSDKESRTISLKDCINKVMTNTKDPLRKNLECIIELRNTSTHFILPEYEILYAPLFQACVMNYVSKLYQYHNIDISKSIPDRFISLSVSNSSFTMEELKTKYGEKLTKHLFDISSDLETIMEESHSPSFAISIRHELRLVKSKDGTPIRLVKDDEDAENVKIITKVSDVNTNYPYTVKKIVDLVNNRFKKDNIEAKFTTATFNDMCQYLGWKSNSKLSYEHKLGDISRYTYSQQLIDSIINQFRDSPNCGKEIHQEMEKRRQKNKANPRSKGFSS